MNTPAHLIVSAALFARSAQAGRAGRDQRRVNRMALAGGVLPDFTLYLAFGYAVVRGVTPETFFRQMYFEDGLQSLMAVENSLVLWGIAAGVALWARSDWGIAFAVSALVHLVTDFFLHNDDARRQFWPLSDWVFVSPVSYWDPDHYGRIVGPVEAVLCAVLLVVLWRRFAGRLARGLVVLAACVQILPALVFGLMLGGPG